MKSPHRFSYFGLCGSLCAWAIAGWFLPGLTAGSNVTLFDTRSSLADPANLTDRTPWRVVPVDLFQLESDPAKSASDPGYYGRDYSFKGDAVVENPHFTVVFWAAQGRVMIYSPPPPGTPAAPTPTSKKARPRRAVAELTPLAHSSRGETISRCEVIRNFGDEVVVEAFFSSPGSPSVSAVFSFGKTEIIEIKPAAPMKGFRVVSPLAYGVAPSFVGDDLIYGPAEDPAPKTITVPANHMFLGLLGGEDQELVLTWPPGKQQLRLGVGAETAGTRPLEALEFETAGQSFYLALLTAPGIWHRETLTPAYLEKEVVSRWQRPFPAKWVTQLDEAGVRTTFTLRESKAQIWRGVPGSYNYPVWFHDDHAVYQLSKKVPPRGESLLYFLEGSETPSTVSTPVDILKATLGRSTSEAFVDVAGRKLRTHHRRGGDGVRRACTCGATEAIQAVFEAGEQVAKNDYVCGLVEDMTYFVEQHVQRIEEYRRFAEEMVTFLAVQEKASPELKPYVAKLTQIAQQIPTEYSVQKENMKSIAYARELAQKTVNLAGKKSAEDVQAYSQLSKDWRAMGGAQDYVLAQCHALTRKLYQEAGYSVATQPHALELAQEIRRRTRQCLRNPDGYEIWPNY